MLIKLLGKVISNPTLHRNICYYMIEADNQKFKVISKDYQAAKDHIFINEGRLIEIYGNVENNIIYVINSKIILKSFKGREKI